MLFIIDEINWNFKVFLKIILGVKIYDICVWGIYVLECLLEFICGLFIFIGLFDFFCDDGMKVKVNYIFENVVGVIGGLYSSVFI